MKRMISNIILFVFSIALFCGIYIGLFKVSFVALCILFLILTLYGFCMVLSWKSTKELKKYEKKSALTTLSQRDRTKTLRFSLTALCPTYFCIALVSLIPLYTYEVWFVTVFPSIALNCLPAVSVLEEYRSLTSKRHPFLLWFATLTIASCCTGIIISSLLFV